RSNARTGMWLPTGVVSLPWLPPTLRRMTLAIGSGCSVMVSMAGSGLRQEASGQHGRVRGRQRAVELETIVDVGHRHAADVRELGGDAQLVGLVGVGDGDPVRAQCGEAV